MKKYNLHKACFKALFERIKEDNSDLKAGFEPLEKIPFIGLSDEDGTLFLKLQDEILEKTVIRYSEKITVSNIAELKIYLKLGYGFTVSANDSVLCEENIGIFTLENVKVPDIIAVWKKEKGFVKDIVVLID